LAVCEVSLGICLLHLITSWKSSFWAINSTEVLFTEPLHCAFNFRATFGSSSVTVYVP
jgi:hypothetical protein